ncbi:OB-fold nucleic acid binding domain-containing protein [Kitasatospora nipponensis]|uniref:OB-fold nucleic acid binding domain-containing protein n=1 Tax=Kitasatospora nipponensis TaxID=258049 RepID=A0ABN1W4Y9_9ACTN
MSGNSSDQPQGRLRRMFSRLTSSPEELQAEELRQDTVGAGCTTIAEAGDREVVTVSGTLRTVTLRPRAGVPALEAELFDGTDALDVVWLGRRSIAGIEPGRRLIASGRLSHARGRRVLFNPRYELRPVGQSVGQGSDHQ